MNGFIDAVVEPGLAVLAECSLRWGVLIAVLFVWLRFLPPRRAATRHLLCLVVLVAGLFLPVLPRWGRGLESTPPTTPLVSESDVPVAPPINPPLEREPAAVIAAAPPDQAAPSADPVHILLPAEPLGTRRIVLLSLATAWVTGCCLLLARCFLGVILLGRLRRSATLLTGEVAVQFAACRTTLGLRRNVVLSAHASVRSPLTLGGFRPAVLVPPEWPDLPAPLRQGGLLHELAHLARRDDRTALLVELVRAVFFFHPLVLWLLARLEREREILCDEMALAFGLDPHDYARTLLHFAQRSGRLLPTAFAIGRRTVKARIDHVLEANMNPWKTPLSRRRAAAVGLTVLAAALALGSVRVRAVETATPLADEPAKPQPAAPAKPEEKPAAEFRVQPFHVLRIRATQSFPAWPIGCTYLVEPSGRVDLGPAYGKVALGGQTLEEAGATVEAHLKKRLMDPRASVTLAGWVTKWQNDPARKAPYRIKPYQVLSIRATETLPDAPISGLQLVEPGGKVDLGPPYGKVMVAGLTLEEASEAVQKHLGMLVKQVRASVTLGGWENDWHDLLKADTPQAAPPQSTGVKKDALRYDGKTFDEWRTELLTELQPARRATGIKALAALGSQGHEEAAIRTILQVMRSYDAAGFDRDDRTVIDAAIPAIRKLGPTTVPALVNELRTGGKNGRRFAAKALGIHRGEGYIQQSFPALLSACKDEDSYVRLFAINELPSNAVPATKEMVPVLAEALKDSDQAIRRDALLRLKQTDPNLEGMEPALIQMLKNEDAEIRRTAAQLLHGKKPVTPDVVAALSEAVDDRDNEVRYAVISVLGELRAAPERIVSLLVKRLQNSDKHVNASVCYALAKYGPLAKEAVPALIELLRASANHTDHTDILALAEALGEIGPDAKEALPILRDRMLSEVNEKMRGALYAAIKKIEKQQ